MNIPVLSEMKLTLINETGNQLEEVNSKNYRTVKEVFKELSDKNGFMLEKLLVTLFLEIIFSKFFSKTTVNDHSVVEKLNTISQNSESVYHLRKLSVILFIPRVLYSENSFLTRTIFGKSERAE